MYDKCLEKLRDYEKIIEENENFCSIEKAIDRFHQDIDDFHTKIFKKLLDDHKIFFQKLTQNIFHNNILELVSGPDIIDQKIKLFIKDKDDIFFKTKPQKMLSIEPKSYHETDEDYCVPQINNRKSLKNLSTCPKRVHFADEEDSDDYEVLKFDNFKSIKNDEMDSKDDKEKLSENTDRKIPKEENSSFKQINPSGKSVSLKIKGTEISSKGTPFSLRLQNFKGIK
jgi:hypothetical protein